MSEILDAFRRWGYLQANLDPLGRLPPLRHPELEVDGSDGDRGREIYCGSIGVEFVHIPFPERCRWIQERMEAPPAAVDRDWLLDRLIRAQVFEQTTHARYVGTKRFSLEGSTALIPLLDEMLCAAAERGAAMAVVGMTHRGRLNVMVHIVGRRAMDVFAGFEDPDPRSVLGGGDVKFHLGATGEYAARNGRRLRISLASNPSHLEAVTPVVLGRARAKQDRVGGEGRVRVLPVVMHGDAAFAGQGILAESLNLADVPGFGVGGTLHVIVNNLIGFTTPPSALHSSRFASDVAKRLPVPIFHVNGEDPQAVVRVGRMAIEYRYAFGSDVVIDLIGFRRHGHSEIDDPTATQPLLYGRIAERPPLWKSYAALIGCDAEAAERRGLEVAREYETEQERAVGVKTRPTFHELPPYWAPHVGGRHDVVVDVETAVPAERIRQLALRVTATPRGFALHPKVARMNEERRKMGRGERSIDWAMAEALAFASLVAGGTRVRMSGQDTRRGTFNQRHAALIDQRTGEEHVALAHVDPVQAPFECYDSILAEASVLGFEYGFSRDYPEALVLWESQFGDFANGAQVVLDQFVSAGEDKWGLLSGLVLLLPHGYEGQGPEHSSARMERFLQLAAEDNWQVCQPSRAAQYFHLLRRQALRKWRKPLVVFTPKSMLRHPATASPLVDLARGRFAPVLEDGAPGAHRVMLCTGKVGVDLREERSRRGASDTAIVLLEQLYPFPEAEVAAALGRHAGAREIVWVQEEPANMGAMSFVLPRLHAMADGRAVRAVKRSETAGPATGSMKAHLLEQAALMAMAFGPDQRQR